MGLQTLLAAMKDSHDLHDRFPPVTGFLRESLVLLVLWLFGRMRFPLRVSAGEIVEASFLLSAKVIVFLKCFEWFQHSGQVEPEPDLPGGSDRQGSLFNG